MAELSPASAGDAVARLLAAAGPILSLDIGSGTQDVLLALPGERAENWPRFVLPSPAASRGAARPRRSGQSLPLQEAEAQGTRSRARLWRAPVRREASRNRIP